MKASYVEFVYPVFEIEHLFFKAKSKLKDVVYILFLIHIAGKMVLYSFWVQMLSSKKGQLKGKRTKENPL